MIISAFSKRFSQKAGKAEDMLRNMVTGGTLFSELGFYYIGPIDGHDVENLVQIFENVKKSNHQGPVLIHVRTQKEKVINQLKSQVINIMVFQNLIYQLENNQNQNQILHLIQKFLLKL